MNKLFSKPKIQTFENPEPPEPDDEEIEQARRDEVRRASKRKGRAASLLTGAASQSDPLTQRRSLLGA